MAVIGWKQFAQTFLRSMAVSKIPVGTAITELIKRGISFRRTDMLRLYRSYAKVTELKDLYKFVPNKYRIPKDLFATSHLFQSKDFLYEGIFTILDRSTGQIFTKPLRLASEYWLTPQRIFEGAIELSEEGFKGYNWQIQEFGITGAFTYNEELL